MEDLVLSIEQCKHLQELGLDMSDAKMTHVIYLKTAESIEPNLTNEELKEFNHDYEFIPTYTLQEILEKLPWSIIINKSCYHLYIDNVDFRYVYDDCDYFDIIFSASHKNILEMAYEALCWVLEKGYLKTANK